MSTLLSQALLFFFTYLRHDKKSRVCSRSDGMAVPIEKSAMVFDWEVRERDAGMYSCRASFYHHAATVSFLVEVTSEEKLLGEP